ncbi:hypothetical protein NEHOM01_1818 [Nematocida homosporus]|uniref:uncharacterized protein n=1 Tax=Nematocida homosporus TaxID=1912981 RepID=UPI002220DF5B|nr:uncharacterized protein NEHOM01_1818 [Nematocida homosporus]KAI5186952.1 hypothetical protein NEHOM01_1818 [Nematocida homosporus]
MRSLGIVACLQLVSGFLREMPLNTIGLTEGQAHLINGIKRSDGWQLKNGAAGSVVNFYNKNNDQDEWSLEMVIKEPELTHPEFAGVYLWYTEDPLTVGPYKGGWGKFNGVLAGIEFIGRSVDIVVSVNHGNADYAHSRSEDTELKDSPDPNVFRGHKELTFKVISTTKNFKIEIYGEDGKLIYDRIRYAAMTEIGTRLSGKYFGISTDYHSAKPSSSIILKKVHMNSREEGETYDPSKVHTEIPEIIPRVPHEVNHPEEEIQHAIAGIEHLAKYLRVVLGEPLSKPITENILYLKKSINFQSAHILEIRDALKALAEISKKHAEVEEFKRNEILLDIKALHAEMQSMRLHRESQPVNEGISPLTLVVFGLVAFAGGCLIANRFSTPKKLAMH